MQQATMVGPHFLHFRRSRQVVKSGLVLECPEILPQKTQSQREQLVESSRTDAAEALQRRGELGLLARRVVPRPVLEQLQAIALRLLDKAGARDGEAVNGILVAKAVEESRVQRRLARATTEKSTWHGQSRDGRM
jgi:hypothetical protein